MYISPLYLFFSLSNHPAPFIFIIFLSLSRPPASPHHRHHHTTHHRLTTVIENPPPPSHLHHQHHTTHQRSTSTVTTCNTAAIWHTTRRPNQPFRSHMEPQSSKNTQTHLQP
ncbi:hypothetical protein Hanom_Chr06g00542901 [Helianthus anomalus]